MQPSDETIHYLEKLVAFNTISSRSNLELIDWAEELLTQWGASCSRSWDDERQKANLLASWGPKSAGGIVLSGHTDVVPVEGQIWDTDPFTLTAKDNRLFGRGSTDMKGFLAVCLACLSRLDLSTLEAPLHLALSYDEEVGCIGVDRLISDSLSHWPAPKYVLIGEPTEMQVVRAHKSINVFQTIVTGQAAHSSQPHRGGGAIFAASRMIEHLYQLGEKKRLAGGSGNCEPPYTTVQVGLISGGSAVNILPAHCEFSWEYRALPEEDPDEILNELTDWVDAHVLPDLRRHASNASIVTKAIARVPPLIPSPDAGIEEWVTTFPGVQSGGTGEVAFATEGGNFKAAGIPSIVCGPGSIDQAHQPNEFIELSQLALCEQMVTAVIQDQLLKR